MHYLRALESLQRLMAELRVKNWHQVDTFELYYYRREGILGGLNAVRQESSWALLQVRRINETNTNGKPNHPSSSYLLLRWKPQADESLFYTRTSYFTTATKRSSPLSPTTTTTMRVPANCDSRAQGKRPYVSHHSRTVSFLDTSELSRAQITSVSRMLEASQATTSFAYSDASSITHFPAFPTINLHALTSLSAISAAAAPYKIVCLLLAILEVEGPDTIRIKKGADAGKEVALLKMIMGDADGHVCKMTAWREVAETWGGGGPSPGVKRGDVIWIENVRASCEPSSATVLTASPLLRSRLEICYRTMPYTHEDNRLRPDLRLGASDAAVKKVESLVKWFEVMAGLGN